MGVLVVSRAEIDKRALRKRVADQLPSWKRLVFGDRPHHSAARALTIVLLGSFLSQGMMIRLRVDGDSMEPTYSSRESLVADRLSYWWGEPQRGDVVAIKTGERRITILKRVIAVPGDELRMEGGRICLNGVWIDEPYADVDEGWSLPMLSLGEREFWVAGDNRAVSAFGKVRRENILGKVW